jgi:hypothetical protein
VAVKSAAGLGYAFPNATVYDYFIGNATRKHWSIDLCILARSLDR